MNEVQLRRSVQALIKVLPAHLRGSFLDLGSPNGVVAARAAEQLGRAAYCSLDLRDFRSAGLQVNVVAHHGDHPPLGPFDTIVMDSQSFEPAFAREMALKSAAVLNHDGVFVSVPPDQESIQGWQDHLALAYAESEVVPGAGDPSVVTARRPRKDVPPVGTYTWSTTFADRAYRFHSGPGVFAPRAIDQGTQALITAVMEHSPHLPDIAVLDLGCGVGTVAVILATALECRVTATDINARALRLTSINAAENGVAERVDLIPSDGFTDLHGQQFDLIVTHPPYHADYAVAKEFIEGAFRHLRLGGSLWLVVKRPTWYANKLRTVFGGCFTLEADGYVVLQSVRRGSPPKKGPDKPATRKHQKRVQQSDAGTRRR